MITRQTWLVLLLVFLFQGLSTAVQAHDLSQTEATSLIQTPPKGTMDMLCRKWALDPAYYKANIGQFLPQMSAAEQQAFLVQFSPVLDRFEEITFLFNKNGSLEMSSFEGQTSKGSFKLSEDGKTLTLMEEGSTDGAAYTIELTKTQLILRAVETNDQDPFANTMCFKAI